MSGSWGIRIGLIAILVLFLWSVYSGWKKKRLKYSIKSYLNSISYLIHIILAMYWIVGLTKITSLITIWTNEMSLETTEESAKIIWDSFPLVVVIVGIVIAGWIILKSGHWFKYTEQEKEWEKESKIGVSKLSNWLKRNNNVNANKS